MSHAKKFCVYLLVMFFFAAPFSSAAEDDPPKLYLLWDIPYGHQAVDVARKLELDHGIRFNKTFYAPSELTPEHTEINSTNDDEISLYGFPYHLSFDDYYDTFVLSFQFEGTIDDQISAIEKVTTGLFSKYGAPDRISLEYPDHELYSFVPIKQNDFSLASALSQWDLERLPSNATILIRISNITCRIETPGIDDTSKLSIGFHSKITLIKGDSDFDTF